MTTFFSLQTLYGGWRKTFVNKHATAASALTFVAFCAHMTSLLPHLISDLTFAMSAGLLFSCPKYTHILNLTFSVSCSLSGLCQIVHCLIGVCWDRQPEIGAVLLIGVQDTLYISLPNIGDALVSYIHNLQLKSPNRL